MHPMKKFSSFSELQMQNLKIVSLDEAYFLLGY